MDTNTYKIIQQIMTSLDRGKGMGIVCLDLSEIHSYLEYFIIVTGNSSIHCRSLARDAVDTFITMGREKKTYSTSQSNWIVLDYGDIVIHIFTEEMRAYYNLEKLWHGAEQIQFETVKECDYAT